MISNLSLKILTFRSNNFGASDVKVYILSYTALVIWLKINVKNLSRWGDFLNPRLIAPTYFQCFILENFIRMIGSLGGRKI